MQAGCVAGPLYGTVTICRGRFRETLWAGDIQYDSTLHRETQCVQAHEKQQFILQPSPDEGGLPPTCVLMFPLFKSSHRC